MNNEIPNNNPQGGIVTPPVETPNVTPLETQVPEAPVVTAAPEAPVTPAIAPAAPEVPASTPAVETEPQGFNAPPASVTPSVDLGVTSPTASLEAAPAINNDLNAAPAPVMQDTVAPAAAPMMQNAPVMESMPGSAPVMPDPNAGITPAPSDAPEAPKKKGSSKIIIIIIVLAVLLVGGYFLYTKVLVSPKKVMSSTVKTFMNEAKGELKSVDFVNMALDTNNPLLVEGDVSLETTMEDYKFLNDYKFGYKFGIDYKNNKALLGASLDEKDKEVLEGALYLLDGKGYLDIEDIYDKLLFLGDTEIDFSEITSDVTSEDIYSLFDSFANAASAAINAGEITSKSTKIDVFGKNTSVTDNIYVINNDNVENIVKAIIKSICDDKNAVKVLAKLSQSEESEIIKSGNDIINSKESLGIELENNIEVHFYTGGLLANKLMGLDIKTGDNTVISSRMDGNKSTTTIDAKPLIINVIKDGNKTTIDVKNDGKDVANAVIEESDTKANVVVTIDNIKITINSTTEKLGNGFKNNLEVKYEDTTSKDSLTIKSNLECKQDSFKEISTSSAVDVNDLTDSQKETISSNFQEKIEGTGFEDLIDNLINAATSSGSYDDYDYDYDDSEDSELEDAISDLRYAASDATFDMDDVPSQICFSVKYLVDNDYLEDSYKSYTGSVLYDYENLEYYIWISDGVNAYKKADFYAHDYKLLNETTASNNCEGLASTVK